MTDNISCRRVAGLIVSEIQRLRYRVWKAEDVTLYDETSGLIADPHDDHALHWGVFDGERLVGAARLCIHDRQSDVPDAPLFTNLALPVPVASMNRLVVLQEYRGFGIGRALDERRVEAARNMGACAIVVGPVDRDFRPAQLQGLGFTLLPGPPVPTLWSPGVRARACYRLLDGSR
jgi:GNAT superfamily N-acetyltransferase